MARGVSITEVGICTKETMWKIALKAAALSFIVKQKCVIAVIIETTNPTVREDKNGQTEPSTKEATLTVRRMVSASLFGRMAVATQEISSTTKSQERVNVYGKADLPRPESEPTKANGSKVSCTEQESSIGLTAGVTSGRMLTTSRKVMGGSNGLTADHTKGSSRPGRCTAGVYTRISSESES